MNAEEVLSLAERLIAIPSVTGNEREVNDYLVGRLRETGFEPESLPVEGDRYNIFCRVGEPRVVFTTHTDVVPAPERMFSPRREGRRLIGRGACDAKGIVATMVGAARNLLDRGLDGFGLLFVVGEEVDGMGALSAAETLKGRGIRYIVNGEPTEGKLMIAHKGALEIKAGFEGRACHSGYPELGEDANAKLVRAAHELLSADLGTDPVLGRATVNIGEISGGAASNIVSPRAAMNVLVRTSTDNAEILARVRKMLGEAATFEIYYDLSPARMIEIPGFETAVASYCTDIPNFSALGADALLYGPGTIHVAHTDTESIGLEDVEECLSGYERIFEHLARR